MFSFFRKDDKDKHDHSGSTVQELPGSNIHYYSDLIDHLTVEHQELLVIYQAIDKARGKGNFSQVGKQLVDFGSKLRGHLLTENVKLYVYLRHALGSDSESAAIMQQFRAEMMHIGKSVADFLEKYEQCDWNELTQNEFNNDFVQVGQILAKRIKTEEETLYPLYLPPASYS